MPRILSRVIGDFRTVNGGAPRWRHRRSGRLGRTATGASQDPIERYLHALDHTLAGPRRMKADMLIEARDGLRDATEAYLDAGVELSEAGLRAVRDFGTINLVAPAFQLELAMAQARRTAILLLVALGAQPIGWRFVERPGHGSEYATLREVVGWLGVAGLVGGVLAVLVCGVGARFVGSRRGFATAIGMFTIAMCGLLAVFGVLLTAWGQGGTLAAVWLAVLLGLPLSAVAVNARRCLGCSVTVA